MNDTDLELDLMEAFYQSLKKKALSANSITAYTVAMRQYYHHYPAISYDSLAEYRIYLIAHYAMNTVNLRICGINHYLRFLKESDITCDIPADYQLAPVKVQRKTYLDNVITKEDYEYFKLCLKRDHNDFWYFIIRFMTATGARVSELIQFKVEHLQLGYMDMYSKGGKLRRIYLPDALTEEALLWLEQRGIKSGFIFLTNHGTLITKRGIHSQLKRLASNYGIDAATVYPHSFRHRFAKNFLEKFNDITLLADLLGHENIETTRIYLKRSSVEQRKFINEVIVW